MSDQKAITPAQKKPEIVEISKVEYEFLRGMVIEMGEMSASIHRLVTAIAPLIPTPKEGQKADPMMIIGVVTKNIGQITKIGPAVAKEMDLLAPIYKKYIRLNEHTNSNTEQLH